MLLRFTSSLLWMAAIVKFGAPSVCYYGQEPDPSRWGKLRWVVPQFGGDACSCTSLRPGALSARTTVPSVVGQRVYTDRPVFTDDRQEITDLFDCDVAGPVIVVDGSIRLVDANGRFDSAEGRVEVYHDGQWGTVCDDVWTLHEGSVVCRQLGYQSVHDIFPFAYFGPGTGPIHLDNVSCDGHETSLAACAHLGWGINNCYHSEDAGVRCAK